MKHNMAKKCTFLPCFFGARSENRVNRKPFLFPVKKAAILPSLPRFSPTGEKVHFFATSFFVVTPSTLYPCKMFFAGSFNRFLGVRTVSNIVEGGLACASAL